MGDAEHSRDESYAIYVDPDEDFGFPGVTAITAFFAARMRKMNQWVSVRGRAKAPDERDSLLSAHSGSYGGTDAGYVTDPLGGQASDTEVDEGSTASVKAAAPGRRGSCGYAPSEEFPIGYKTYYAALPSIEEQNLVRYQERMLFWSTCACFAVSFLLMGIAGLLVMTGRHRMRLEVDAGVTLAIMVSLGAASAGLGMTFSRRKCLGWMG